MVSVLVVVVVVVVVVVGGSDGWKQLTLHQPTGQQVSSSARGKKLTGAGEARADPGDQSSRGGVTCGES